MHICVYIILVFLYDLSFYFMQDKLCLISTFSFFLVLIYLYFKWELCNYFAHCSKNIQQTSLIIWDNSVIFKFRNKTNHSKYGVTLYNKVIGDFNEHRRSCRLWDMDIANTTIISPLQRKPDDVHKTNKQTATTKPDIFFLFRLKYGTQ